MGDTSIGWTRGDDGSQGSTWNPIRGCSFESTGCENCYAAGIAARFSGPGLAFDGFARRSTKRRLPLWTGKVELLSDRLFDPLRWTRPRRIFANSMSDLFHEDLPDSDIDQVLAVMLLAPEHTFQILTKRAKRMHDYMTAPTLYERLLRAADRVRSAFPARAQIGISNPATKPAPWIWLGVSVENQRYVDERIPFLLETPAAVRFISAEPLLEGIDVTEYLDPAAAPCGETENTLDWVITGFESGPRARPGHVAWIRNILVDCEEAGVPAFVKQLGARPHDWTEAGSVEDVPVNRPPFDDARLVRPLKLRDRAGADPREWEESLRVQEFPGGAS